MIRAIALDNDFSSLERIAEFCKAIEFIDLKKVFSSVEEARVYLEKYPVDLLFSDFTLPEINGIEFFQSLAQPCRVVFISSSNEFAAESYELNAIDYLLKPFSFQRFQLALKKVKDLMKGQHATQNTGQSQLCFRIDYSLVKVAIEDILLIEGLDNYLKIYLDNQKPLIVRSTMKAILAKLPADEFVQVHRSFIIPVRKIDSVRNKVINIGEQEVPIGNRYENAFFQLFGIS
ncbi:LytTR family DNA-binding domain-containing protein [Emticicia sp. C21]|uniref:LytR/AlgR family response regulator transcription factor n=1 Tax=Emticicia sp. C21 TaxID=2302915 RepID=UPI000E3558BE|nr:LytTR family DNA-binding domain-containing protein [Emticicia sp. C21]RFS15105.1 DNA-binding response regulator [Emticicia sp. C21]